MGAWNKTFEIKDLLDEDDSNKAAKKAGEELAKRLREKGPFAPHVNESFAKSFAAIDTCEGFNKILDRMYDHADLVRVWLD